MILAADTEAHVHRPGLSRFVDQAHLAFSISALSRTNCASKSSASLTPASSPISAARAAFMIRAVRCTEKSPNREDTVGKLSATFRVPDSVQSVHFHSSLLRVDVTEIALTFSSPLRPLPSLPQGLHPLSLISRHFGISQPSAATREKQKEARGKIRYSALESLGGRLVSETLNTQA